MLWLRQSTQITLRIGPFVDKTDGVTAETGETGATQISKDGGAFATGPSLGTHDADGWYPVTLTTGHTDTLGPLQIKKQAAATHLAVWHEFMVVPAAVYDTLVDGTDQMPSQVEGMDANVITAAAINTGAITAAKFAANAITSTVVADNTITAAKINADAITEAKIADNAIASEHLAAGAIDAAAIANGAIDALTFAAGAIDAAAIATNAIDADALATDAVTEIQTGLFAASVTGTATGGSTTTIVDTARTEAATDYWKGSYIRMTSGAASGQTRVISAFTPGTDTITVDRAFTGAVANTDTYDIFPADMPANFANWLISPTGFGEANVQQWADGAVNNLIAGRVDVNTSVITAGAIDSIAIATNAIDADALAADAVAEIADGVCDEDIVAAHGTADTLGRLLSELSRRAVTFNTDVVDGSILGQLADDGTATFDRTTDSVQAIRDRGDAGWTTGAGGSPPELLQNTTITITSQTEFTLAAGSSDDDAYNGCIAVITDASVSTQKAVGLITDYTGSTKTVFLGEDPLAGFTMATGDTIDIIAAPKQLPDVLHDAAGGLPTGDANGRVDVGEYLGAAAPALVGGRYDASVGAMAANVVTDTAINADAITAAKVANGTIDAATFATGAIDAAAIANGAIDALTFASGAIDSAAIATGAIDADAIASDAITAVKIQDGALTAAKFAAGSVMQPSVADTADSGSTTTLVDAARTEGDDYWNGSWLVMTSGSAVGQARKISDFVASSDTITVDRAFTAAIAVSDTYEIWPADFPNNMSNIVVEADGMVHADVKEWLATAPNGLVGGAVDADVSAVQANAITASAIAANAITSSELADGAITNTKFGAGAIDAAAIANASIDAATFVAGAIDANAIAANAITSSELADGAITNTKFAANAIDAAAIAANAIGSSELATGAIGDAQIAANAITAAKINAGAITNAKFAAGAIDANAIAADAITSSEIQDGALTKAKFAAGAVHQPSVNGSATGGSTTTLVDTARTEADDYWNGSWLVMTSGSASGQARKISDFVAASDTITVDRAFTAAVVATDAYEIFPADFPNNFSNMGIETDGHVHSDMKEWLGSAPLALVSQRPQVEVDAYDASVDFNATQKASINTEVVDVIRTDTVTQISSIPAANASLHVMVQWLFACARNKRETTASVDRVRNDGDTGNIATATLSDDTTTFTRAEYA